MPFIPSKLFHKAWEQWWEKQMVIKKDTKSPNWNLVSFFNSSEIFTL